MDQDAIPLSNSNAVPFSITFLFVWRPVLQAVKQFYLFPNPITAYMHHRYRWPAIYRWVIYQIKPDKPELLYIGSTKKLCPDRITGYLHPKNSSTNNRLNSLFQAYVQKGFTVGLEILVNQKVVTGEGAISHYDVNTLSRRDVLENLLINHYRQQGFELLNK